jgi:hypothetical protein
MTNKINIKDLLPLLKKGWVAMNEDDRWFWYLNKPSKRSDCWDSLEYQCLSETFDIKPAYNWERSLIKCDQLPKTSDSNANVFNIAFDKGWNAGWNAHCEKCVNDIRG